MIQTKQDLNYYLECDRIAMSKKGKAKPWDITYWFLHCLRHYEFWYNQTGIMKRIMSPLWHIRFKRISEKCGFTIPINKIGPGLCLPHYGTLIISSNAIIGENCKIHAGVNIGASSGNPDAKQIGNNVYIGPGAKIIGGGYIANNVVVGANAVVIGNVEESGITVGGIPAKKISDKDSSLHLIRATEIYAKDHNSRSN
ncbi:serine acetyltransferase [uncultured Ruminococcus sp.]|uniref:serine acetyltransferase n=1 Tax=uncultured Ruminococcus sp. TaxID=165186 RepID=UPI002621CC49|nr:serine acetyltransferase [uncultured Ruminococcus sp.]